jgi:SPX domain protein involved in polyphosphate accumulation
MARDRMQKQRFELKYLISEETALKVREFVQSYLDFDEYSVGKPNYSYPVHSVYLDSDDLRTYWDTINGNKNRFKLRLRYYSTHAEAPVFFEIKRRMNSCILKQRGGVRQDAVKLLLDGHFPLPEHLVSKNPNHYVALQRFCELTSILRAKPKVHIGYMREAYVSDDDTVRVTLDRGVMAEPNLTHVLTTQMEHPTRSFCLYVILELKFTNRFPDWFKELVRVFNVMQCGAAKYVESIGGIGHKGVQTIPGFVVEEPTGLARDW